METRDTAQQTSGAGRQDMETTRERNARYQGYRTRAMQMMNDRNASAMWTDSWGWCWKDDMRTAGDENDAKAQAMCAEADARQGGH